MMGVGFLWGCDAQILDAGPDSGAGDTEDSATDTQTSDPADADFERPSAFEPTSTTITRPYTGFYSPLAQGTVYVSGRNLMWYGTQTSVDAQFYEISGPGDWSEEISYIIEPDGIDSCGLGLLPVVGYGSEENPIQWMDAGELRLHSAEETYVMDKSTIDEEIGDVRYYKYDWPDDFTDLYGEALSMTATGGDTPAFTADALWGFMPSEYALTSPRDGSAVSSGPLALSWTSDSSAPTVEISFYVFLKANESEAGYEMQDVHQIKCTVVDDGDFSIPAEIMNLLPAGYSMNGGIYRKDVLLRTVTSDFLVQFVTAVSSEIRLQIP